MDNDLFKGTCSTHIDDPGPAGLTEEVLKQAIQLLEDLPDPYQDLAKSKGMNLDAGDIMVVPKGLRDAHNLPDRKGVHFTDAIDCGVILMKGPVLWSSW